MTQPQRLTSVGEKTTFIEVWKWGQELEYLHARIAPRFARPELRWRALVFLPETNDRGRGRSSVGSCRGLATAEHEQWHKRTAPV
ncbi:hypothetical protein KDAU_66930 [Dictyobacter aurantiacus]|uniref:Uncharacterized protein n=1 Tax=Dictyobacter aurantiacus TaxID=1936993 RepID=A0A401ZRD9_9CHLR|nr:hypothetical protein KDAU_66930 [Dictyobacter aurantiacus]